MRGLSIEETVSEPDREIVFGWLREYNLEKNRPFMELLSDGGEEPLFLVARDSRGNPVGGLAAETVLEWLKINIMAVDPDFRGQGIGSGLLAAAEKIAAGRGCHHSYVDTMDFQSPEFYRKHSYTEAGRLPNWDSHGHDKFIFTKRLS